jgi:hypothetical protein
MSKNNTIKSQSFASTKKSSLSYNLTSDLFPLHYFTEFTEYEVTNRYECLVNKRAEPCEMYCKQKSAHENMTNQELWACYNQTGVPRETYGKEKCAYQFNQKTQYVEYFYCLTEAGVKTTLKESCGLYQKNKTEELLCYEGKVSTVYKGQKVPPDRDYCTLLEEVRGGGQKAFFDCMFNQAGYPREKQYCNIYYPFGGNASNSTEGIKILD